jgi:hypothetical protein
MSPNIIVYISPKFNNKASTHSKAAYNAPFWLSPAIFPRSPPATKPTKQNQKSFIKLTITSYNNK